MWNELIIKKYNNQITIDKKKIKEEIIKNASNQIKEYKLSEIIFEVKIKSEIKKKYDEVFKSIKDTGFKNSASMYSISESAKIGGDVGWINEISLSSKIKKSINKLQIGEISEAIVLPNGILILQVTDIKNSKIKIDYELQFKKKVDYERNRQFNQFSKIYFNKIKQNLNFYE